MKTYDEILIDLTAWSGGSPCGAVAFINNEAVTSEYCDDIDDFKDFLDAQAGMLSESTALSFKIRAYDIGFLAEPIARIDEHFNKLTNKLIEEHK